jgi:hypothetical protein
MYLLSSKMHPGSFQLPSVWRPQTCHVPFEPFFSVKLRINRTFITTTQHCGERAAFTRSPSLASSCSHIPPPPQLCIIHKPFSVPTFHLIPVLCAISVPHALNLTPCLPPLPPPPPIRSSCALASRICFCWLMINKQRRLRLKGACYVQR